jgi:hypothetical protein
MAEILILAEHKGKNIKKVTYELVNKASELLADLPTMYTSRRASTSRNTITAHTWKLCQSS